MSDGQPLAGVKVLDLTRLLPGPFLTQELAALGADVLVIEDPGAPDLLRAWPARFAAINRGKRRRALDLKGAEGRAAFLAELAAAHVVVEGFRPGVLARLGLGWDVLSAARPEVVLLSLSGFGQDGPYAQRAGHDLTYQALAGTLALAAAPGQVPAPPAVQVADLGGALFGLSGLLAALYAAARTGRGRWVDVSMTEAALALASGEWAAAAAGDAIGAGRGPLHGALACYGVYACQDGALLAVAALEPKFWLAFCAAIGRAGATVHEPLAPPDVQAGLRAELTAILASAPRAAWLARLAGVDCCVEPVLGADELAAQPQHAARGALGRSPIR